LGELRWLYAAAQSSKSMPFHRVLPFYQEWSRKYGMISGVVISDPDMIKEVLVNNNIAGSTEKLALSPLGKLLLLLRGLLCLKERKGLSIENRKPGFLIWSESKWFFFFFLIIF
jgi:hypothetical protein